MGGPPRPAVGDLVLHSAGPCGRVVRVWEPGAYHPDFPADARLSCAVVELSTGDALCLDDRRAADFTVVPEPLADAYELLFLPRNKLFARTAILFAEKLAREQGVEVDRPLLARLLSAALREALRPPRGEVPG